MSVRHELKRMQLDAFGELDVPHVTVNNDGSAWADADELRAWRLQNTSAEGA